MARTVPVSSTQAPGNFITGALWNAGPAASNTFLTTVPLAQVWQSAAQSIPNNSWTAIGMDSNTVDTDSQHSNTTNNSRITCQVPGWYLCGGTTSWSGNATGQRFSLIAKNGVLTPNYQYSMSTPATGSFSFGLPFGITLVQLGVGDYIELYGYQSSGGALNTTANSFLITIWMHS